MNAASPWPVTVTDLPAPPAGRSGWPWTVGSEIAGSPPRGHARWPSITIVTPSFNQGQYLEETIRSVLLQGYPDVEYIIFDGASTDDSIDVIKKYERWISHWRSEPDGSQSAAVNKGLRIAKGELVGWQNSDDYYYPSSFVSAATEALSCPEFDVYFGDKDYVDSEGKFLFKRTNVEPTFAAMIPWPCVNNESMFFKKRLFDLGYFLDEGLAHYMDYDLFWRLFLDGFKFKYVPGLCAGFRQHSAAKSSTQVDIAQNEAFDIFARVYLSGKADANARELLLGALRRECSNDFSHFRFRRFREHVRKVRDMAGKRSIPLPLIFRYFATFLGVPFCKALQSFKPASTNK